MRPSYRFLFDPEAPPTPGVGAPAPAPVADPTPAPAPVPAVDVEQRFSLTRNGETVTPTLGELAKAYSEAPDASVVERAALLDKAFKENDTAAANKILEMYGQAPTPEPTPVLTGDNAEIAALQSTVGTLQTQLSEATKSVGMTTEYYERMELAKRAEVEKFPLVQQNPQGIAAVHQELKLIQRMASENNLDLNTNPDLFQKAVEKAFERVNQRYAQFLSIYVKGDTPAAPGVTPVVNDQAQANPGMQNPFGGGGEWVPPTREVHLNNAGQPIPAVPGAPIPTTPVTPPTGGGIANPPVADPRTQKFSPEQLRGMMAQRQAQLRGGQ